MQLPDLAPKTEAQAPTTSYKKLLTIKEVSTMVGLSRAMIYRSIKNPVNPFPAPLKIGVASRWVIEDVYKWIDAVRNSQDC